MFDSTSHTMTQPQTIAWIESLDHEGRGVARVDGKTVFIEGALPYEQVRYHSYRQKPSYENAHISEVLKSSFMRSTPACPHFNACGGCSMQHIEFSAQVAIKQRVLEDNLQRLGKVRAEYMLTPISGPAWHYRHRARLSARWVSKKGGILLGFHEKNSSFIADMGKCLILPAHISALILPLRQLIAKLSIATRMPQIEVAVGEQVDALVFRNMEEISAADHTLLREFSEQHSQAARPLQIWLQPKGPDSCYPLYPLDAPKLSYRLPQFNIDMPYYPTEFTQVNPAINAVLVARALQLLQPQAHERIADLFCGIGNFTLPIARSGARVHGIEGSAALVKRAQENAVHNQLQQQVSYQMANLFDVTTESLTALGKFDKMLIDPPRDGAAQLCKALDEATAPQRIVYVSCNPATLARDAAILVRTKGYTLKTAGIINMFPHTAHVESIACFEKTHPCKTAAEIAAMEAAEEAERQERKAARQAAEAALAAEKAQLQAAKAAAKEERRAYYFAEKARREAAGLSADEQP
ncbi:23S rRNA (uracil(1939)-C(5))-methyltransferase RlmD [Neisseriaceae bacterium TC5R-5]|nr:23S rRNA (uracil(1939)-C(5))-methyltransferase RlmD [Neisseriaceae bacterium TC5R-5]